MFLDIEDILKSTPIFKEIYIKQLLAEFNYPVSPDSSLYEDGHGYIIYE